MGQNSVGFNSNDMSAVYGATRLQSTGERSTALEEKFTAQMRERFLSETPQDATTAENQDFLGIPGINNQAEFFAWINQLLAQFGFPPISSPTVNQPPVSQPPVNQTPVNQTPVNQQPINTGGNNPGNLGFIELNVNDTAGGQNDVNGNGFSDHAERVATIGKTVAGIDENNAVVYNLTIDDSASIAYRNLVNQSGNESQNLNQFIDVVSTALLDKINSRFSQIVNQPNPDTQVYNMSVGLSKVDVYDQVFNAAQDNPRVAQVLLGGRSSNNQDELYQAAINYVDNRMNASGSRFNQSLNQYQNITRQAAQRGIFLVTATGNAQDEIAAMPNQRFQPGAGFNFLGMSDSVITVGSATENNPNTATDNTASDFSSTGNNRFRPTVTAVGDDLVVNGFNQAVSGSSYAAPQIAGLIYDLKRDNPNLTFDQIVQFLQQNSINTASSSNAEGFGFIDALSLTA